MIQIPANKRPQTRHLHRAYPLLNRENHPACPYCAATTDATRSPNLNRRCPTLSAIILQTKPFLLRKSVRLSFRKRRASYRGNLSSTDTRATVTTSISAPKLANLDVPDSLALLYSLRYRHSDHKNRSKYLPKDVTRLGGDILTFLMAFWSLTNRISKAPWKSPCRSSNSAVVRWRLYSFADCSNMKIVQAKTRTKYFRTENIYL